MVWTQVKQFNIKRMGKRAGWCLQNCREGFGITTGHFPSAKADLESQIKNGTLHDIKTLPKNCAVPVYLDTTSRYEHVEVVDHGTWYSDGVRVNPGTKVYGWGELCDGVRVVKWVEDQTPKKTETEIAKEVIAGKWGNGDDRKNRLTKAGYNYNNIQTIVNKLLTPGTSRKSDTEIAKEVIAGKWGNGADRKNRLTKAGYNYNNIQAIVNKLLK